MLDPDELLGWVDGCSMTVNKKLILEAVICTTFWVIWRFRNDLVHGGRKMRKNTLFDTIRDFSFL